MNKLLDKTFMVKEGKRATARNGIRRLGRGAVTEGPNTKGK